MRMSPEQVALRAYQIIMAVMTKGSDKSGSNDTWLNEPRRFHSDKAIRHQISAQLGGGDEHRHNSLVRVIMDICQREFKSSHLQNADGEAISSDSDDL